MKILVLSAMEVENKSMIKMLTDYGYEAKNSNGVFVKGSVEVHCHVVGIGKVNASIGAIMGIAEVLPDVVISQGCCAGVQGLKVGDVFVVEKAFEYDFNLEPIGYRRGELPITGDKVYGFSSCLGEFNVCPKGIMMTADKFCLDDRDFRSMIKPGDVVGADMETAAIAHTCHVTGDKFVGIRAVSDVIGVSNQANEYESNEEAVCLKAARAAVVYINWLINS